MKKIISLVLVIFVVLLSLLKCSNNEYYWGDDGLGFPQYQHLNAKVMSDRLEFDINDVTLDFYYCFYCLDDETIEEVQEHYHYQTNQGYWEATYAIYLSKTNYLLFEGENGNVVDYENKVNAQLIKYIDHEELFNTNYGYTTPIGRQIEYNHSEKLTIPAEYFDPSWGVVFIHVVRLTHWKDDDMFSITPEKTVIKIEFDLLNDNTVVLRER